MKAFLIKALTTHQDRAGVVKTLKNLKELVVLQSRCQKIISPLVHVTDNNGLLVYSDELTGFIELELTKFRTLAFRMLYLVNLRDRKLDEWARLPQSLNVEEYLRRLST
uniref:hypothetical protein n=1 Tax=Salmonella sp. TaxID=599 RepID=UPI001CD99DC5|nr:hypothetical protein [Salmonella sp.]